MSIGPLTRLEVPVIEANWNNTYLQAPTLWQKTKRVGYDILRGAVVFWLLARILRPVIRACILPASWMNFSKQVTLRNDLSFKNPKEFFVKTPDGALIHAVAFFNRDPNKEVFRAIVVHNANAESFTTSTCAPQGCPSHPLMEEAAAKEVPNTALVFFDHRSVGHSKGAFNCCEDLVVDALSVRQAVEKRFGLETRNIDSYGHSLGGAVAAVAMARWPKSGGLFLFSDRSFTSLDAVIKGIAGRVFGAFACYLLSLSGFGTLDPAKALVGRNLGAFFATGHSQDRVIRQMAQMSEHLPSNAAKQSYDICLPEVRAPVDYHNAPLLSFRSPEVERRLDDFMRRSQPRLA